MRAGAYPPGAGYDIDPAIRGMEMGMRIIPRHPFSQNAIRTWLARVAEQCGRIFAAMRPRPLDVRRQGEGNMGRVGRRSLCGAQTTKVCGQGCSLETIWESSAWLFSRFMLWRDHRQEECKRQEREAASGQWEQTRGSLGQHVTVSGDAPVDAGQDKVAQAVQDLILESNAVTRRSSSEV